MPNKQGPRRRAWEALKQQVERINAEVLQFNRDLASYDENNPDGMTLPMKPISPMLAMPPMPRFGE